MRGRRIAQTYTPKRKIMHRYATNDFLHFVHFDDRLPNIPLRDFCAGSDTINVYKGLIHRTAQKATFSQNRKNTHTPR